METGTEQLITHLKQVLLSLHATAYPDVPCPPSTPKRASVALILRVQPHNSHWPPASYSDKNFIANSTQDKLSFEDTLNSFFSQPWVQHGDPEILFIKRATRAGDKWNGHTALPGGKRDPEDVSDEAAAAREALEEVGIDLSPPHALCIGNLPQRVVTTSWGKVPLMVLCPYIYLLTSSEYPAQRLQPSEVASTHWVSLRALMSPVLRTYEYADVSARLAKTELGIKRWFLQTMLSKMMFAAVRLVPSNSVYCSSIPGFIPSGTSPIHSSTVMAKIKEVCMGPEAAYPTSQQPLLLWGLTLGVVSDFLEHIPPHDALELWTYPTFTNWDVRFTMWAMSYRFRKRKSAEMRAAVQAEWSDEGAPQTAVAKAPLEVEEVPEKPGEVGIAGLGVGRHWGKRGRANMIARGAAVNSMLEGYYPIVRKAVAAALIGRVTIVSLLVAYLWRKWIKGRI